MVHIQTTKQKAYMQEPWKNLSSGLVAAADDAEQGVEHHGQPAGCGHKLWSSLKRQVSEEYL